MKSPSIIRHETIGNCELYLGDCLEIIPTLENIDALVTDPPYGVMLGELNEDFTRNKGKGAYEIFDDTPEYVKLKVIPAVEKALSICRRGVITPGNRNLSLYPPFDDIGVWFNPAGSNRGKWGYILAHVILFYGKNPRAAKQGYGASSLIDKNENVNDIKKIHPCPKPLHLTKWMVNKASFENETILDPFMGSGTTGVACVELNRNFIGIEINEKYFNAACDRIRTAAAQGRFDFESAREKNEPLSLF